MEPRVFTKGMNQDVLPKFQEEGTYRFALNAVLETELDGSQYIANEESNTLCAINTPNAKVLIGSALTNTDETVLFYFDPAGDHEIGIINPDTCAYTQVIHGECLNFSDAKPINALVKIRNGCDRVVYFTDNYNKYRVLNLDSPTSYNLSTTGQLYCPKLDFTRDVFPPCLSLYNSGTNPGVVDDPSSELGVGVYYASVRFLDAFQNATDWQPLSRPVAIGNEPSKYLGNISQITHYDGGSNVETSDFYAGKSNKAIKFQIGGENAVFDFYQIAVVKRTGDAGDIEGVDILNPMPWKSGDIFTYNGYLSQIQRQGTLEEILTPRQRIEQVGAHAIKNEYLFLGNTSETYYDYTKFQQYASKIKVEYIKSNIINQAGAEVKKGKYYFDAGSFMENETYPFGIIYVHGSGKLSPVFHIPGRASDVTIDGSAYNPYIGTGGLATDLDGWDTGTTTVYGDILNGSLDRWRQISTATRYGTSGATTGLLGYHECDSETYPDIPTCEDLQDGYWGKDWSGELIIPGATKIRHHKMPGPELRDPSNSTEGFKLGLLFSNVEYPSDDIIGHYFVYGDRAYERTVLAKGALIPISATSSSTHTLNDATISAKNMAVSPGSSVYQNNYVFISADGLIKQKFYEGDYFKIEKIYRDLNQEASDSSITDTDIISNYVFDTKNEYEGTLDRTTQIRHFTLYNNPSMTNLNHNILSSVVVNKSYDGAKEGNENYEPLTQITFVNNSINTDYQVLHLQSGSQDIVDVGGLWRGKLYYGALMQHRNVFNNLFSIQYKRATNCMQSPPREGTKYQVYAGDTANNRVALVDFNYVQTGIPTGDFTVAYDAYYLSFLSQDTYMNYEFRHGSKIDKKQGYFQFNNVAPFANNHDDFRRYMIRKMYSPADKSWVFAPEVYEYNNSFSFLDGIDIHFPIQYGFDYCNLCVNSHPYRIYSSQKDNQETQEDLSRIAYTNNYRDLNGLSGEITDMFVNFDNLYVTTTNSIFLLPVNAQVFQTDTASVFLGAAEVLSIPPRELKNASYAFGGQQFFKSRVGTEYGTFFMDGLGRKPLLLTESLEDLSQYGMRNFFREHGDLKFLKQYTQLTGRVFPVTSASSTSGVGYLSTYDPLYKRIIFHKKDYAILPQYATNFVYGQNVTTPSILWFDGTYFYYNSASGVPTQVELGNTGFFENLSYTLSFSFLTKHWVSFHSYLPYYAFNTSQNFFTSSRSIQAGPRIFKHRGDKTHQTFYNVRFPHVVDISFPLNPLEVKTASSVLLTTKANKYDVATDSWSISPIFYNKLIGYTSNQSTGLQQINIKNDLFSIDDPSGVSATKLTDGQWRLNDFRDMTIANTSPIWDYSWAPKAGTPYSYIDKTVATSNIDYNKTSFDLRRLRDNYLGLRLFYDNSEDIKLLTDVAAITYQNKNR